MAQDSNEIERQIAQLAALRNEHNAAAIDAAIATLRGLLGCELDGWKDAGDWTYWLKERPLEQRDRPWWWGEQQRTPNRPVMGVSWWEALAFCRWLAGRSGLPIALPSEAQWERAARGPSGDRPWPWGDWSEGRANTKEAGINHASAVGCFPQGQSAEGVEELAGNVWEWCSSLYRPYPYQDDERNDPEAKGGRVIRGGAYYWEKERARCSCRYWYFPDFYDVNLGFRVLFSLASS
jgi:formylglycine-generating enzyme required for sulfatase activity